ncbi:hypothetical protein GCM10009654_28210 [Streptomyces hebeiensis]|uniref:Uncharacterized protein n=1 Tax=Streptomyces hebeiensis TaxID=229486 RepID=A0ABN1UU84_9ACTN
MTQHGAADNGAARDNTAESTTARAGGGAGSSARQRLSLLIAAFGVDGALVVPKDDPGAEGADLAPGAALRWPKCRCGNAVCPDVEPPPAARTPAEELSALVAERNRRSRRGGL